MDKLSNEQDTLYTQKSLNTFDFTCFIKHLEGYSANSSGTPKIERIH